MLTGIEPPVLDTRQLPIYMSLKNVVENKEFMPEGEQTLENLMYQPRLL